jgi:hypothetical protein
MEHLRRLDLAAFAAIAVAAFLQASAVSATTLEVGGVPQTKAVSLASTLASGTSYALKDETGTTGDTCTASEFVGKSEGTFSGASVSIPLSTWFFKGCTHTTTTIKPGKLTIAWTSGTNATVTSSETEVTTVSTFFGVSTVCKTGTGTKLGTITGVKEGHATLDIDVTSSLNCGVLGNMTWTGTYTVTSPTGLGSTS